MPITALPPDTVRSIGSSQVLTDSCSVVKELIDNSIDAGASAIFIEVSVNVLDVVQVKDNGHGILPDDRSMVCRPHCTSKIRYFDDLKDIGGKSLGFRGEALASAAEMSGGMVISTRIEGEPTAVSLTINRQGEIEKQVRVSQPVGTTVRITDFLKNMPVRRQTALKTSTKSIAKIRRLLQAYAYARPSVKFSLKLCKAKNDKSNWIYAPASGDTVLDAAIKICGSKLVDQCQWKVWKSSVEDTSSIIEVETNEKGGAFYKIEALLPSPTSDISIVNNTGQYVSIDSRPVSCTRGTLKRMISLYRSYLKSGFLVEGTNVVKDPFLCMNLVCPLTSYDVNVEPAKDDILFTNADSVLAIFECFLKSVYGGLRMLPTASTQSRSSDQRPRGFDVLLARKSQANSKIPEHHVRNAQLANRNRDNSTSIPSAGSAHTDFVDLPPLTNSLDISVQNVEEAELIGRQFRANHPDAVAAAVAGPIEVSKSGSDSSAAAQRQIWQRNMYRVDEDDVSEFCGPRDDDNQLQDSQSSDEDVGLRDVSISNPWAFAKLNAPIRRSNIIRGAISDLERNDQLLTPGRQEGEFGKATARQVHEILGDSNTSKSGLPTPARDKGYQASSTASQASSPEPFIFPEKAWGKSDGITAPIKQKSSQKMDSNCGALDTWVQKPMDSRSVTIHSAGSIDVDLQHPNVSVLTSTRDFVSARTLPTGTPLSAIPERASKSTRNRAPMKQIRADSNKPFISPINDPSRVWFDMEPKRKSIRPQPASAQSVTNAIAASNGIPFDREDQDPVTGSSPTRSIPLVHPDLAATMDYEIRKQAALQHWKANQRRKAVAKDFIPSSEDEPSRSSAKTSPHQNRYSRAVANLHSADGEAASPEPQLPPFEPGDQRAYLLRAQEHGETTVQDFPGDLSKRPRTRRKTGLLPLETIPEDRSTRSLILTLGREEFGPKKATFCDEYISIGTKVGAFSSCTIHQIRAWEAKLRELVEKLRRETEEDGGIADERTDFLRLDIWTSLQAHRATTNLGQN